MSDLLLHPAPPDERPWKFLLPVLALAFVARAAIALSGDFVLHPDEIMQYLEPAHRLVFGNGVTYWEYFYGARSWLVPGLVAGVLKLFDIVGLGQPAWYVGGVKLVFCAISLLIPAGMYFFARWHFGEPAARVALLMGAFWYELVGFAHKPMTEFVATALLMSVACSLCAACAGQTEGGFDGGGARRCWWRRSGCSMPRWLWWSSACSFCGRGRRCSLRWLRPRFSSPLAYLTRLRGMVACFTPTSSTSASISPVVTCVRR